MYGGGNPNKMTSVIPQILRAPELTSINWCQKRTNFNYHYKHGPSKLTNPEPTVKDKLDWFRYAHTKENFLELWKRFKYSLLYMDPNSVKLMDKTYIFEHFDNDEFLKKWRVGSDSDSYHGYSYGQLVRSPGGHALFRGVLDNRIPDDGLTANSGFVALIGSYAPLKGLFQMESHWDWMQYDAVEIKFRGDGRKYNFVVNNASNFDNITWYDNHSFPLYTRGGPYWQTLRIPFRKMMFLVKGGAQDISEGFFAHRVKNIAITISDRNDGPFNLEIDYIGLLRHSSVLSSDDMPYEGYQFPHIKFRELDVGCDPPEE